MKKIFFSTAFFAISLTTIAQQDTTMPIKKIKPSSDKIYCVILKDGKPILVMNDTPIKNDIQLKNGSKMTTSGSLIKKNGDAHAIKPGTCVDQMGNEVEDASK